MPPYKCYRPAANGFAFLKNRHTVPKVTTAARMYPMVRGMNAPRNVDETKTKLTVTIVMKSAGMSEIQ